MVTRKRVLQFTGIGSVGFALFFIFFVPIDMFMPQQIITVNDTEAILNQFNDVNHTSKITHNENGTTTTEVTMSMADFRTYQTNIMINSVFQNYTVNDTESKNCHIKLVENSEYYLLNMTCPNKETNFANNHKENMAQLAVNSLFKIMPINQTKSVYFTINYDADYMPNRQ